MVMFYRLQFYFAAQSNKEMEAWIQCLKSTFVAQRHEQLHRHFSNSGYEALEYANDYDDAESVYSHYTTRSRSRAPSACSIKSTATTSSKLAPQQMEIRRIAQSLDNARPIVSMM